MRLIKYTFICLLFINVVFAGEWHVKKDPHNLVKFISTTTLLDFEGTTNNIDGYIYWEGDELFAGKNELYFEVELNTLKTGIGKRDRDMREDVLETHKWPITYFKGSFKQVEKKENTDHYSVELKGIMFIHGVEKEMIIPGEIKIEGEVMSVESKYSIFLKDFEIEAPSLLAFIKVAEEIKLEIKFNMEQYRKKDK